MKWSLVWTNAALRDMRKLDPRLASRLRRALVEFAETGHGDVAKLKGVSPSEWRLRVGDRRLFFRYISEAREIQVLRVLRRDGAY